MREHAPDVAQLRPQQRQEVVDHRQLRLRDDRRIVLEHQVVVAMNAAADRVLHRQQPVRRLPRRHGEDVLEAIERDRLRVRPRAQRRRLTMHSAVP